MFVVHVELKIKPGLMSHFMPLMRANAQSSLSSEEGCVQFDVCTLDSDPESVVLYEVYTNENDFALHLKTEHFQRFDADVADMVAGKTVRTGRRVHP